MQDTHQQPFVVLRLQTVVLTTVKQDQIKREIDRYTQATRYVIRRIRHRHLTPTRWNEQYIISVIEEEFRRHFRYDDEVSKEYGRDYLRDVVRTAVIAIGRHRKRLAHSGTLRDDRPIYDGGQIILSPPILKVQENGVLLKTEKSEILIPFDSTSKQHTMQILPILCKRKDGIDRVRLIPVRDGSLLVDIRIRTEAIVESIRRADRPWEVLHLICNQQEIQTYRAIITTITEVVPRIANDIRRLHNPWRVLAAISNCNGLRNNSDITNAVTESVPRIADAIRDSDRPWEIIVAVRNWQDIITREPIRTAIEEIIPQIVDTLSSSSVRDHLEYLLKIDVIRESREFQEALRRLGIYDQYYQTGAGAREQRRNGGRRRLR